MATNDYNDKIDDYLNETLSPEEKTDFEAAMSTQPSLREQVKIYKLEQEAVHAMLEQRYLKKVKDWRTETAEEKDISTSANQEAKVVPLDTSRRRFRRLLSLAASVLVLIVAGNLWYANSQYSNQSVFATNYVLADSAGNKSGSDTTDNFAEQQLIQSGTQAFFNHDYTAAIAAFEKIPTTSTNIITAQYYLGHSHLSLNNYPTAIQNFETVLKNNPLPAFINRDKLLYNLLLTKVAAEQMGADFEQDLKDLSQNGQPPYNQKAKELEKQLESFWRKLVW